MKNDKEKLEKLFNLLKDGMDMLTNDGNGLHIGVSAIIRNGDDSYFSIKDADDERENNLKKNFTFLTDDEIELYTKNRSGKMLKQLEKENLIRSAINN